MNRTFARAPAPSKRFAVCHSYSKHIWEETQVILRNLKLKSFHFRH